MFEPNTLEQQDDSQTHGPSENHVLTDRRQEAPAEWESYDLDILLALDV